MMTHGTNPIEEARAHARKAIAETYSEATEAAEPTKASYEYDTIIIEDEKCDAYEVAIMHDEKTNTFALVERSREARRLAEETEHELQIANLLQAVEVKVMTLVHNCRTEEELTAAWAAISASASQTVRDRLHEIGGDVDRAMQNVDHFLLTNPQ